MFPNVTALAVNFDYYFNSKPFSKGLMLAMALDRSTGRDFNSEQFAL